jgi:hypothetical protein
MPWEIRSNYGGCAGYAVVKLPDGSVSGCHATRESARSQLAALYASEPEAAEKEVITNEKTPNRYPDYIGPKKKRMRKMEDLYEMLTPEEKAFHDALVRVAEEYGPFDQGTSSIWVGYETARENEDSDIGVKCGNCSFHVENQDGSLACKLLSYAIEEDGKCRLAAIPDGLVNPDMDQDDDMDMDDFMDDMMERMGKADVSVGSMVSWNSSGGRATGKVIRVIRNGKYNVPNSDFTITGTEDDPAVAIRIYRNGEPTDTIVGHKMSTLRRVGKSMNKDLEDAMSILESMKKAHHNMDEEAKAHHADEDMEMSMDEDWEKREYTPEQRRAMANRGQAMPDGSFPIATRADLANAIQSVGRAANYAAARRHIISRARDLGAIDMLPEDWNVTKSLTGLFKNMPTSAKRSDATGNQTTNISIFKAE